MLKSIEFENYKTFVDLTRLSFEADAENHLLKERNTSDGIDKAIVFVGENASGKTSILIAIRLLMDLLFFNSPNFSLMKSAFSDAETATIKYTFSFSGEEIVYSLEFSKAGIENELLLINQEQIFKRTKTSVVHNRTRTQAPRSSASYIRVSGLGEITDNKLLRQWYMFVANSAYLNCLTRHTITTGAPQTKSPHSAIEFLEDDKNLQKVNEFLAQINYKHKIGLREMQVGGNIADESNNKIITFTKSNTNIEFASVPGVESAGNITLANTLPYFMYATETPCMLIVDEFSSGFHDALEESLIRFFLKNSERSQLFLVTHSTNILDGTLLRPDQVFSVRFDQKEFGQVKRFSDSKPRIGQNMEMMYLDGAFDELSYKPASV